MLLGSSISNTKQFLQKTLENFKSCFSPGYQKLPKTPPQNQFSYSVAAASNNNPCYKDLEKLQWDSEKENKGRRKSKKKGEEVHNASHKHEHEHEKNQMEKREECDKKKNKKALITHQKGKQKESSLNFMGMRGNGNCVVEKKLRELEMLDMSDVDYVLDIEEVLHYYSRLTCPVYLEIVDKFFIEMYSEFFGGPVRPVVTPRTRTRSINYRLK